MVTDIRDANASEIIKGLLLTYKMDLLQFAKYIVYKLEPQDVLCVNELTDEVYTAKDVLDKIHTIVLYCEERNRMTKRSKIKLLTIKQILNGVL